MDSQRMDADRITNKHKKHRKAHVDAGGEQRPIEMKQKRTLQYALTQATLCIGEIVR